MINLTINKLDYAIIEWFTGSPHANVYRYPNKYERKRGEPRKLIAFILIKGKTENDIEEEVVRDLCRSEGDWKYLTTSTTTEINF